MFEHKAHVCKNTKFSKTIKRALNNYLDVDAYTKLLLCNNFVFIWLEKNNILTT